MSGQSVNQFDQRGQQYRPWVLTDVCTCLFTTVHWDSCLVYTEYWNVLCTDCPVPNWFLLNLCLKKKLVWGFPQREWCPWWPTGEQTS